jgi:hypothetical protein
MGNMGGDRTVRRMDVKPHIWNKHLYAMRREGIGPKEGLKEGKKNQLKGGSAATFFETNPFLTDPSPTDPFLPNLSPPNPSSPDLSPPDPSPPDLSPPDPSPPYPSPPDPSLPDPSLPDPSPPDPSRPDSTPTRPDLSPPDPSHARSSQLSLDTNNDELLSFFSICNTRGKKWQKVT